MKNKLKISIFSIFLFVTLLTLLNLTLSFSYCTMELKQCPDGSFVGRDSNNNCEFGECSSKNLSISINSSNLRVQINSSVDLPKGDGELKINVGPLTLSNTSIISYPITLNSSCPESCSCVNGKRECSIIINFSQRNNTIDIPVNITENTSISSVGFTKIILTNEEGVTSLWSGEVKATSYANLTISNSNLIIKNNTSEIPVGILPDEALENSGISKLTNLELKTRGEKAIYTVSGTSSGRLFLVIPVTARLQTNIDALSGEVISAEKPWWSFLASGI